MRAEIAPTVIAFPHERVRPADTAGVRPSAEIVIFTGVRIERMYDLAERLPPARTASRRGFTDGK